MSITKQQAGILFGNSYKLYEVATGKTATIWKILSTDDGVDIHTRGCGRVPSDKIGTSYKIIAYPLSELTKPIMWEGKEIVPLMELAKLSTGIDLEKHKTKYLRAEIMITGNDGELYRLCLDDSDYSFISKHRDKTITTGNQKQLFDQLREWNFNVDFPAEFCINPKEINPNN